MPLGTPTSTPSMVTKTAPRSTPSLTQTLAPTASGSRPTTALVPPTRQPTIEEVRANAAKYGPQLSESSASPTYTGTAVAPAAAPNLYQTTLAEQAARNQYATQFAQNEIDRRQLEAQYGRINAQYGLNTYNAWQNTDLTRQHLGLDDQSTRLGMEMAQRGYGFDVMALNAQDKALLAQYPVLAARATYLDAQGNVLDAEGNVLVAQGAFLGEKGTNLDVHGSLIEQVLGLAGKTRTNAGAGLDIQAANDRRLERSEATARGARGAYGTQADLAFINNMLANRQGGLDIDLQRAGLTATGERADLALARAALGVDWANLGKGQAQLGADRAGLGVSRADLAADRVGLESQRTGVAAQLGKAGLSNEQAQRQGTITLGQTQVSRDQAEAALTQALAQLGLDKIINTADIDRALVGNDAQAAAIAQQVTTLAEQYLPYMPAQPTVEQVRANAAKYGPQLPAGAATAAMAPGASRPGTATKLGADVPYYKASAGPGMTAANNGRLAPSQLVMAGGVQMERATGTAFTAMQAAAKAAGITLKAGGGYRSYADQAKGYAANPRGYAKPGQSNHGWGQAIDLNGAGGLLKNWNAREVQWLKQNAPKFGFSFEHPNEPWHVRYVGYTPGWQTWANQYGRSTPAPTPTRATAKAS